MMRKILLSLAAAGAAVALSGAPASATYTCPPPCVPAAGEWHVYTGNFGGSGIPALSDPNWQAVPATPGGQHSFASRGTTPYQTGAPGNGDWFYWSGTVCP